jgi:flavin-binding protein dodecin
MATKQADTVYKIVEVVGVSDKSWEDAGRAAVETAAGSLRDLRVAEVTQMDMKVENGKVSAFWPARSTFSARAARQCAARANGIRPGAGPGSPALIRCRFSSTPAGRSRRPR